LGGLLTVSATGAGAQHTTVQAALDCIPATSGPTEPYVVLIGPGVYNETINIVRDCKRWGVAHDDTEQRKERSKPQLGAQKLSSKEVDELLAAGRKDRAEVERELRKNTVMTDRGMRYRVR